MQIKQKSTQRTNLQNRSAHKYFKDVADAFNESGISVEVFLQGLEVDFTPEMIKSIFRKIGKIKFGKDSTADLTTIQLTWCYEELNRHTSKHGLHIPFPCLEILNNN